ncbi:lipase maturation factor family protein [Prosthecobacter sp.]|uniref:lipase maturation factor family protein n=1 Tax=Prosthecobacter sp. TaxID=1965333 RepID=UPI003783D7A8
MNPILWLDSRRGRYTVVRWLFPRLLAGIYLIAFASWGLQYDGLVGEDGILPAKSLMENIHAFEEREHHTLFWQMPSVFHWHYSDAFAHGILISCCVLAVLVMAGVAQGPLLALLWFSYLSFATTGEIFMGYQWDALLLEAGLLALFIAPWRLWSWRGPMEPPRGSVFLLHWLLFRLMFLSGYVKIGGGDLPWHDMTALLYHYETQPLPNGLSWFAHQAPRWIHVAGCWIMYFIELGLPFAIFLGRWGRLAAALGFLGLMAMISATGNYNFFDLLTAVLAITLLDDRWWLQRVRRWLRIEPGTERPSFKRWPQWPALAAVLPVMLFTLLAADSFLAGRIPQYKPKLSATLHEKLDAPIARTRSFNAYGLFQDMTEQRPEIILEVSDDGAFFLPVDFKYKPGDLKRRPPFIAPHQPRLDWQMWFAALYPGFDPRRDANPASPMHWFGQFCRALLQHKKPVWDLLEPPPFPIEKITQVRARLYRYHFTSPEVRQATGEWWQREEIGPFSGRISLDTLSR